MIHCDLRKVLLCIILLKTFTLIHSMDVNYPISSDFIASSNLSLLSESPSSSFHNPSLSEEGFSCSYIIPFTFTDIVISSVSFTQFLKQIHYSIGNQFISNDLYKENNSYFNLNYTYQSLTIGSNLRYFYQKTDHYRSISHILFDCGLTLKKYPIISSFYINNFTEEKTPDIQFPTTYQGEIGYYLQKKAFLSAGFESEASQELTYKIGTKIEVVNKLHLISSYQIKTGQFAIGTQFKEKRYQLGYAIQLHQYLNPTHSISLNIYY